MTRDPVCVNAHDRCYSGAGGPCPYCETPAPKKRKAPIPQAAGDEGACAGVDQKEADWKTVHDDALDAWIELLKAGPVSAVVSDLQALRRAAPAISGEQQTGGAADEQRPQAEAGGVVEELRHFGEHAGSMYTERQRARARMVMRQALAALSAAPKTGDLTEDECEKIDRLPFPLAMRVYRALDFQSRHPSTPEATND